MGSINESKSLGVRVQQNEKMWIKNIPRFSQAVQPMFSKNTELHSNPFIFTRVRTTV